MPKIPKLILPEGEKMRIRLLLRELSASRRRAGILGHSSFNAALNELAKREGVVERLQKGQYGEIKHIVTKFTKL